MEITHLFYRKSGTCQVTSSQSWAVFSHHRQVVPTAFGLRRSGLSSSVLLGSAWGDPGGRVPIACTYPLKEWTQSGCPTPTAISGVLTGVLTLLGRGDSAEMSNRGASDVSNPGVATGGL